MRARRPSQPSPVTARRRVPARRSRPTPPPPRAAATRPGTRRLLEAAPAKPALPSGRSLGSRLSARSELQPSSPKSNPGNAKLLHEETGRRTRPHEKERPALGQEDQGGKGH